jgi:hypothetical protein
MPPHRPVAILRIESMAAKLNGPDILQSFDPGDPSAMLFATSKDLR